MLHCFEGYGGEGGNENRGEGMAPVSQGAPWPVLVLGRLWAPGALLWGMVTQCTENWGGTGPLSGQSTALPLISRMGGQGGREAPLGHGQKCLQDGDCLGQEGTWAFVKSKYWEKEEFSKVGPGCPTHIDGGKNRNFPILTCPHQDPQ